MTKSIQAAPPSTTVRTGDTLSGIAERTGVSLETLKKLNPSLERAAGFDRIYPGDQVTLPTGAKDPGQQRTVLGQTASTTPAPAAPTTTGTSTFVAGNLARDARRPLASKNATATATTTSATTTPANAATQHTIDLALSGRYGKDAQKALQDLTEKPQFKSLPQAQRDTLLQHIGTLSNAGFMGGVSAFGGVKAGPAPKVSTADSLRFGGMSITNKTAEVASLLDGPGFKAAPPATQQKLVTLYGVNHEAGITLAGDKRLVAAKDQRGGSLIDHVNAVATGPLQPGLDRKEAVGDLVRELHDPSGSIWQKGKNTCTATSMQYMMAKTNPGEYARLYSGLASSKGSVSTVGGDVLKRDPTQSLLLGHDDRSVGGRLLQPALMELGNGSLRYNSKRDVHSNGEGGLRVADELVVMKSLYGHSFSLAGGTTALASMRSDGTVTGKASWMSNGVARAGGYMSAALHGDHSSEGMDMLRARSGKPTLTSIRMDDSGGHAVVVEKVEAGRVYYRNSLGTRSNGDINDPTARLESARSGMESI
jgi:LysM repeat protein